MQILAAESELVLWAGKEDSPEKHLFREDWQKPAFKRSLWPVARDKERCLRLRSQAVRIRFQSPYYSREALYTGPKPEAPSNEFSYISASRPAQRQQGAKDSPLGNYTRTERPLKPALTSLLSFGIPAQRNKSVLEQSVLKEKQRFLQKHKTVIKLAIRLKKRPQNAHMTELPSLSQAYTFLKPISPGRTMKIAHLKTL